MNLQTALAALLVFSFSALANVSFSCTRGDETVPLTVADHEAHFGELKLINRLDVDTEAQYRSYAFIHNPWYDLMIERTMLAGANGYVELLVVDLNTGESATETFACTKI